MRSRLERSHHVAELDGQHLGALLPIGIIQSPGQSVRGGRGGTERSGELPASAEEVAHGDEGAFEGLIAARG